MICALPFEPIAVTGIGMVTAQGLTLGESWQGIRFTKDVLRPWEGHLSEPLSKLKVAQCPPLPRPADLPASLWDSLARTQQLACICADAALESAGLPRKFSHKFPLASPVGCFLATTVCGMDQNEKFYEVYRRDHNRAPIDRLRRLQPYEILSLLVRRHGLTGPRYLNLTTCVGSAMAIGAACDAIHCGRTPIVLAGGTEALCRVLISGFNALRVVATDECRPFDLHRPGITIGEGAAILVLESLTHVRKRSAQPIGFIRGFAAACDAWHITKPDPEGIFAGAAIQKAIALAGFVPGQIDYLNAHGTGTRDNDAMEAKAIHHVFGSSGMPPVSSTKRLTGHTFAAAGAIEAAICLQALVHSALPPNAGFAEPDPACDLPLVKQTTARSIQTAVSCNFAFGGNNTALVFSRTLDDSPIKTKPINQETLGLFGLGVFTDQFPHTAALFDAVRQKMPQALQGSLQSKTGAAAASLVPENKWQPSAELLTAAGSLDPVAQYALYAIDQAWRSAELSQNMADKSRMALVLLSGWGTMDSTTAYLESMFDADGRYASPLSFTRSVNSSLASLMAIHFGIHGPCETLAHDAWLVTGPLERAADLLSCGHADLVIVCWTDQLSPIALDLCRCAVTQLHRRELERYLLGPCGYGAIAMVLGRSQIAPSACVTLAAGAQVSLPPTGRLPAVELAINPFPTDGAVRLAAAVAERVLNENRSALINFCESVHHGQTRFWSLL
jgi:3-oxoacyl-(acyl-carrier-protein) synthase